ncbi:MAG TPA: hypothetical protein VFQ15_05270 [Jiangellaceae bacterium]|nr:hypothetical protein [Jiangellaceae bacterium]
MVRQVEIPEQFRKRPFTVSEADAAGLSRGVLSGPRFRAPFPGVRVPCTLPDTLLVRCEAAALVVPGTAAFCHETAAELWGLPLPRSTDQVHTIVPDKIVVPQIEGIVGHTGLDPDTVQTHDGVRAVHPDRTFFDLAPKLRLDDLVAVGDAILRRWSTLEALTVRASGLSRRRGIVRAREALRLLRPGVDSRMESILRMLVIRAGLPCPEVNVDVYVDGGWVARPDLSYPELKIAIEFDGDHHRTDKKQWRHDVFRGENMRDAGWIVIVLTADDVLRRPELTIHRIRQHYQARLAALTSSRLPF